MAKNQTYSRSKNEGGGQLMTHCKEEVYWTSLKMLPEYEPSKLERYIS